MNSTNLDVQNTDCLVQAVAYICDLCDFSAIFLSIAQPQIWIKCGLSSRSCSNSTLVVTTTAIFTAPCGMLLLYPVFLGGCTTTAIILPSVFVHVRTGPWLLNFILHLCLHDIPFLKGPFHLPHFLSNRFQLVGVP